MSSHPKVVISIINFNSAEHTIKCVESIIDQTSKGVDYKIVIVDNDSEPDDFSKLEQLKGEPKVSIVRNNLNIGFSGGHMSAVNHSSADFYLFQNNDSYFLNDYLGILLAFAERNEYAGILGGSMVDKDGSKTVSFHHHPKPILKLLGTGILNLFRSNQYPSRRGNYSQPIPVEVINGSSMFVSADHFKSIGCLDTSYFLYCEEEDLALRMNRAGFQNWYIPEASYLHLSGMSTPKKYEFKREFYISFMYYYRKNYSFLSYKLMQLFQFFKLLKRGFRNNENLRMALFILKGAPLSQSLRHSQMERQQ